MRANDAPARPATDDPPQRFSSLLDLAQATPEIRQPTAMTLATVGADGRPSARIVLLKGVDRDGLVFYTNVESRKAREIQARPEVALVVYWPPLELQIRFEGRAEPVSLEEANAYFATRPRGSQLGAWASQQSAPMAAREELEARLAEVTARFAGKPVSRPPFWSGYRVRPTAVEFWKSGEDRLHERELYTRERQGAPWSVQLLNP